MGASAYAAAVAAARRLPDPDPASPGVRIALAGAVNTDLLVPGLRVRLAAHGFAASARSTAFGAWVPEVLAADASALAATEDVWVVWLATMGLTRGGTVRTELDAAPVAAALDRLTAAGRQVVVIPPEASVHEDDPFSPWVVWRRRTRAALEAALPARAVTLDVAHVLRRIGTSAWHAPRYWEQAKAPAHPDAVTLVAELVADTVAALHRPAVRGVVVDLDGTLWGGTVGEVGPDGLDIDPDGVGRPYLELQRLLLDLRERGVALGVVSKNDPGMARAGLARPEMLLREEHLLLLEASWEPKHLAIRRFAERMNVGIDAVCLLDDHPGERDEAAAMLPGLVVPDLPERPADRVPMLLGTGLFLAPRVSAEDRRRADDLAARTADRPADLPLDDYLAGLGMELHCEEVTPATFDRALSLLHKTNQFNVTLWRPTASELEAHVADPGRTAATFRLVDRIGDAGIIGVVLAGIVPAGSARRLGVDAWVLSCRAFGRGVEWAMAEWLGRRARAADADGLALRFVPGPRNALVADLGVRLGLTGPDGDGTMSGPPTVPTHHLRLVGPAVGEAA